MATLLSLLPKPVHDVKPRDEYRDAVKEAVGAIPRAAVIPPYGARQNYVPRAPEDFGDGGAFPEIHIAQYPLGMGKRENSTALVQVQKQTSVQMDAEGNVKYDAVIRQNMRKDLVVHTQYKDLVEKDFGESALARPSAEEEAKTAERTRAALGQIVSAKIASAQPTHVAGTKVDEPVYIRYTPSQAQGNDAYNSGAKQRIIRLQEMPVDPLEPPKFKHKKVPGGPPSPPVPVMHSPPRKVTVADMQNWKVPPCISNWKNIKGYTIPLDKRLAADGRGLQEVQINDKFAKLSESLFLAERVARKEIETRSQMQKTLARKQKEVQELELRDMAAAARKAGMANAAQREVESQDDAAAASRVSEDDLDKAAERDELRRDRRREIQRELRMEHIGNDLRKQKGMAARDKERDVSEKIALGQSVTQSKDGLFDQRLFNQASGMDTGFKEEDSYDLYDKPLFKGAQATYIYRAKEGESELLGGGGGEESGDSKVTKILEKSTSKFAPDRGFKGTEQGGPSASQRQKPVEFEKERAEDPFGLGELLTDARGGGKGRGALDGIGKQGFMSASGGGASLRDRESSSFDPHGRRMEFTEGGGSGSGSGSGSGAGGSSSSGRRRRDDGSDEDRDEGDRRGEKRQRRH